MAQEHDLRTPISVCPCLPYCILTVTKVAVKEDVEYKARDTVVIATQKRNSPSSLFFKPLEASDGEGGRSIIFDPIRTLRVFTCFPHYPLIFRFPLGIEGNCFYIFFLTLSAVSGLTVSFRSRSDSHHHQAT